MSTRRGLAASLQQFLDRLAVREDPQWPSVAVMVIVGHVDTETVIDRRQQTVAVHCASRWFFAAGVGGPDDLTHFQSAAREKDAHGPRPVVAAGSAARVLVFDPGCAPEFTAKDKQHVPV